MRSTMRFSSLTAIALALGGCAFTDGDPWGQAEVSVALRFTPPEGRLDDAGRLKTSNDFRVELSRLEVHLETVTLLVSEGGGPLAFDPASPPPGYSLCHNGHCHADDGSLPTYAEVEAAILGTTVSATAIDATLDTRTIDLLTGATLAMQDCPDACALPQGTLSTARVELLELTYAGTVFDGTSQGRLPAEGLPISGTLTASVPLTLAVGAPIEPGESVGVRLDIGVAVAPGLFDGIDWPDATNISDTLTDNLREQSELELDVTRFDP